MHREQISATFAGFHLSTSANRLNILAAQLLQSLLICVIGKEAATVRLQPPNNETPKRTTVSIELHRIRLLMVSYHPFLNIEH